MVEDVAGVVRGLSGLLVPEDEVDPVVQAVRHVVALQRRAVPADKLARVAPRPWREYYVAQGHARLLATWKRIVRFYYKT